VLGGAALVGVGAVLVAGLASLAAANWWSARAPGEQPPALEVPAEPPREVAEEPVPPPAAEPAVAATPKPETRRSTRREPASPEPAPPEPTTAPLATREPASAAPTASAAAPAASTTIKVTADQLGARVFLDGKAVGRTPLAGLSVTDGSHTLMVEGPASALSRPIDVGPGRPMRYHCRLSQNDWQVE
jgi:outer membrane biosynthesis protein TonB